MGKMFKPETKTPFKNIPERLVFVSVGTTDQMSNHFVEDIGVLSEIEEFFET